MHSKYYLLAIAVIFCGKLAQAQIPKGSLLFGGSVSYSKSEYENYNNQGTSKLNMTGINPAFGIAVRQNLVVGVEYNFLTSLNEGFYTHKSDIHYGGLFARRYWNLGKKFYVFGHGSLGAGLDKQLFQNDSRDITSQKVKTFRLEATLRPGFAFNISRKVQLETLLMPVLTASYENEKKHNYQKNPPLNYTTDSYFSISTGLGANTNFALGVRFLLAK